MTRLAHDPLGARQKARSRECASRDTQLEEDAHRYRGNGAGVMASLRTAALNLLRFDGFLSIRAGLQARMHDITTLLGMALRQPQTDSS